MMPRTDRERRLVALLILVAMLALGWLAVLSPLIDGFAARAQERADLIDQHRRNVQIAARLPLIRAKAARQREQAADYMLRARNAREAQVMLREQVRQIARRHRIVIKSVQDADTGAGMVRIRADAMMQNEQLVAFLRDVQDARPVLIVPSLSLSSDAAFETGRAAPLGVRVEVAAAYSAQTQR